DTASVPRRPRLGLAAQLAQLGRTAVGGLLLVVLTPSGPLGVNSCAFLASALLVRFGLRARPVAGVPDGTALVRDSLRGLRRVFAMAGGRRLGFLGWVLPMFFVWAEALGGPARLGQGGGPPPRGRGVVAPPARRISP